MMMSEPQTIDTDLLRPRLERALEFAASQVHKTIERDLDFFPIYTRNGHWRHDGLLWTDWVRVFTPG